MNSLGWTEAFITRLGMISLEASALAGLILAIQFLLRRHLSAHWRYALWLPVVFKLLLPVSFESSWSVFNLTQRSVLFADQAQPKNPITPSAVQSQAVLNLSPAAPLPDVINKPASDRPEGTATDSTLSAQRLFLVWFAGAGLLFFGLLLADWRFRARLRSCDEVRSQQVLRLLRETEKSYGLSRRVRLLESRDAETPSLFGCIHTVLFMPSHLIDCLSTSELRHIFHHELAHVKRRDLWWNYLFLCVQIIHWFNPMLWLVFRRIRQDREMACDAIALKNASEDQTKSFGETLIKLAGDFHQPLRVPGLIRISSRAKDLKLRIEMLKRAPAPRRGPIGPALLLILLSLTGLTNPKSLSGEKGADDFGSEAPLTQTKGEGQPTDSEPSIQTQLFKIQKALLERLNLWGFSGSETNFNPNAYVESFDQKLREVRRLKAETAIQKYLAAYGIQLAPVSPNVPYGTNRYPSGHQSGLFLMPGNGGVTVEGTNINPEIGGVLLARAKPQVLEQIKTTLQTSNSPPLIKVKALIIEVPTTEFPALRFEQGLAGWDELREPVTGQKIKNLNPLMVTPEKPPIGPVKWILRDPAYKLLMRALQQRGNMQPIGSLALTTFSGRDATVSSIEPLPQPRSKAWNPSAYISPMLRPDGSAVELTFDVRITIEKSVGVLEGAKVRKIRARSPHHQTGSAILRDGETIALEPIRLEGDPKKELRVFLTCNTSHDAETVASPAKKNP